MFTFRAEFPLEAERANALAVRTVPVTVAVGHLALVVSQIALFAFPPGVALALAVDVLAALAAQHRTDACGEKNIDGSDTNVTFRRLTGGCLHA